MEIPDAYQEYLAARREADETEKIATVSLPATDMAAVWKLIAEAVDEAKDLPAVAKQKWESILRSIGRSVHEAS